MLAFAFGGDVAFGEGGAGAEEEELHLFFHDFLRVGIERVEAVLVHHHLGVLNPQFPGVFGDAFVDALAEFALPGDAVEAREFAAELDALDHAGAGLWWFAWGRRTAGIVGHRLFDAPRTESI